MRRPIDWRGRQTVQDERMAAADDNAAGNVFAVAVSKDLAGSICYKNNNKPTVLFPVWMRWARGGATGTVHGEWGVRTIARTTPTAEAAGGGTKAGGITIN